MKLLIAIPALNEEDAIQDIIERSLAAREYIIANSPVSQVAITVVSDGSTDRTAEIARQYSSQLECIEFEANRGYGAAIKEAWRRSDADLLGFLDADGTCDPAFFADLCDQVVKDDVDMAVGVRMAWNNQMPVIRRIGNFMFAMLLSLYSDTKVRDSASGMRVIKRSSLSRLLPLPDGLHFTPAMSARVALADGLSASEKDMPYAERKGRSKLSVKKDGLRFLRVITETAFLYRPSRPLALAGIVMLVIAIVLMILPIYHYVSVRSVSEWMIYRFVTSHLLGTAGLVLLCASYLTLRITRITVGSNADPDGKQVFLERFFSSPWFWYVPILLTVSGGLLVVRSALELIHTGATYEHWSRFIAMSYLVTSAIVLGVTRIIAYSLDLISERVRYMRDVVEGDV